MRKVRKMVDGEGWARVDNHGWRELVGMDNWGVVGGILDEEGEEDGRWRRMGKSGGSWMEGIGRNG